MQQPHPPIVIGASPTPLHFRHIVEYGDVWMPIEGRFAVDDKWVELQQVAADAGRDPATLQLGVFGAKPDAVHLAHLRDVGASFVALGLPPLDRDAALATMDRVRPAGGRVQRLTRAHVSGIVPPRVLWFAPVSATHRSPTEERAVR